MSCSTLNMTYFFTLSMSVLYLCLKCPPTFFFYLSPECEVFHYYTKARIIMPPVHFSYENVFCTVDLVSNLNKLHHQANSHIAK